MQSPELVNEKVYLWQKYSMSNPSEVARQYRNPYSERLIAYAKEAGNRLLDLIKIPEATAILGGSLGYDAAIEGSYDIDFRILLPDTYSNPDQINSVSSKICRNENFHDVKVICQDSGNIIHHTWKIVRIEGLPDEDVYLTLNIQAQASYSGLAGIAKRLPRAVIDRYVAAKGKSKAEDSELEYERVKDHWKCFLGWLISNEARTMDEIALQGLLSNNECLFPLFLKEKQK